MRLKMLLGVLGVSLIATAGSATAGGRGLGLGGGGAYIGGGGPGVVIGGGGRGYGGTYASPYGEESYDYGYNDPAYDYGDGVTTGRSAAEDYDLQDPLD